MMQYMVAPGMLPYEIRALTVDELRKKNGGKQPKEIDEDGRFNWIRCISFRRPVFIFRRDCLRDPILSNESRCGDDGKLTIACSRLGEFGAINIRGPEGSLRDKNLKVPFEIGAGEAETYTIRLTEKQAALLPKQGKE